MLLLLTGGERDAMQPDRRPECRGEQRALVHRQPHLVDHPRREVSVNRHLPLGGGDLVVGGGRGVREGALRPVLVVEDDAD